MKIGLRTIKTGIAISLAILVSTLLHRDPLFALLAVLIAIQPTVSDSWRAGLNRILGTFIGALIGLIFSVCIPANFIAGGLGIILLITIMNQLHWNEAINIACVVFIAVFLNLSDGQLHYAINRLEDTTLGIIIAVAVNYLLFPPTYDKKAIDKITEILKEIWEINLKGLRILQGELRIKELLNQEKMQALEESLLECDRLLEMQKKEERLKVYGASNSNQLMLTINLVREVYHHLLNIQGVLDKGLSQEVLPLIEGEDNSIGALVDQFLSQEVVFFNRKKPLNLNPLIEGVRRIKVHLKAAKNIDDYATDEVVKILVVIYNFEEALSKLNILATI